MTRIIRIRMNISKDMKAERRKTRDRKKGNIRKAVRENSLRLFPSLLIPAATLIMFSMIELLYIAGIFNEANAKPSPFNVTARVFSSHRILFHILIVILAANTVPAIYEAARDFIRLENGRIPEMESDLYLEGQAHLLLL